jgi:hypothetical protein
MHLGFVRVCVLILAIAIPAVASAQSSGSSTTGTAIDPQVAAMLRTFAGGPELRAAVASAIEANPGLIDAIIVAARGATLDQKKAIGAGISDAVSYYAKLATDNARLIEARLQSAMIGADADTRFAFLQASTPTLSQVVPGFGVPGGITTNDCRISPSSPTANQRC